MENEERAQLEAQHQKEVDNLKEEVTRLTSLLEQALRDKSGKATHIAQPEPMLVNPFTPQNLGANEKESQKGKMVKEDDLNKFIALEQRMRAFEGIRLYDPIKAVEMCLVPNVVIPKNFRVPEFVKYTRTQCPITHLKAYCNKMAEVVDDEKLLIHFFQDNLSDVSLTWYMRLDNTKVKKWKDLVDAFMRQYKFNIDVGPDRLSFQAMEKDNKESIREYTRRWSEVAAQVNPPMLEKEMISLFSNTFKAPFFEYLVRSSAQYFTDLVVIAKRIEQAIGLGKITNPTEKNGFTESGCQGTYRSYS
ncbi:uncharacterized protein LOC112328008 [Populus trichocarpa]|jgi:hypothetical protein|uniref:uncharacterized protein LOC112328008 n=1 Tax=Populus trichocarpa TaxID=3694 RepID=UPI000D188FC7|nr:uncharacterized protein LOC112328008 [Populus trichocarpa]XP_024459575.1 uncharacterized protein LOC112328008 [Populus trichocarpa]XP_052309658.1 uncharacterized protein LOC112328008 [Populus trichocarpa]XP_052309659.1 uncharacterized protein LOC112328008 [Populus trichocarpa]|eukprot:XP_024459574.1 uncharacterized protein LOC112328006 [Populus trichocarpa]